MLKGLLTKKPDETKSGEVITKKLIAQYSFEPLITAIEKEPDREVKLGLIKALCTTSNAGPFPKPEDFVERMEKMIFAEDRKEVIEEATMAIFHCSPINEKKDMLNYLLDFGARAEGRFGVMHVIPQSIGGVTLGLIRAGIL